MADAPIDPTSVIAQQPNLPSPAQPTLKAPASSNLPTAGRLIADLIKPPQVAQPGQLARPQSRLDAFEHFLSDFIGALGQGFSNAGSGPGANLRGAGAAMQFPLQKAQLESGLEAQQAEAQQRQAQANLTNAQAQMGSAYIPGIGQVTAPVGQLGSLYKGAAAAAISGQAKLGTQQLANQGKLDATRMQLLAAQGQLSKMVPDVDPQTGQQFYRMFNKYGQEIGQADANQIPQFMTRTSSTTEFRDDGNGNIIALPKTTTTGPAIPGRGRLPLQGSSGATSSGPRVIAPGKPTGMVVGTDSRGVQVAGTPQELRQAGVNNYVKLGESEADKVNTARQLTAPGGLFDLVDKDLAKFQPGELSPLNSRLQEFLAGKWGSGDPRYVALRTHLNGLLGTAMMQAHVGAKGGEQIMEHFEGIAQAGRMDAATMKAALDAEKQYVMEKAMRPVANNGPVRFQAGGRTYTIPPDKVDAFKKDFPSAIQVK